MKTRHHLVVTLQNERRTIGKCVHVDQVSTTRDARLTSKYVLWDGSGVRGRRILSAHFLHGPACGRALERPAHGGFAGKGGRRECENCCSHISVLYGWLLFQIRTEEGMGSTTPLDAPEPCQPRSATIAGQRLIGTSKTATSNAALCVAKFWDPHFSQSWCAWQVEHILGCL